MSQPRHSLPAHPSLEQLRKQAKDLLKGHKSGDSQALSRFDKAFARHPGNATLADAQFVLARELGYPNWPALTRHVNQTNPTGLAKYQRIASIVAAAYTTGDMNAIRQLNWLNGTAFPWDRDPAKMQARLTNWSKAQADDRSDALALEDARFLVAKMMGVDDWATLVRGLASAASGRSSAGTAGAVFYSIDPTEKSIQTRGPLDEAEWDCVIEQIRAGGLTSLHASGAVNDSVMRKLGRLTHLKRLNFDGAQVTDDGLLALGNLTGLQMLDLSGPKPTLTDAGLAVLAQFKHLKEFKACWPQKITDAGTQHLKGCHALESVNLMGTHTGDGTVQALADKQKLRFLTTGRKTTDAAIALLHQIPAFKAWQGGELKYNLTSFAADGPNHLLLDGPITDDGLRALAGLDGLFGLGFFWHAKTFTSQGLAPLADMTSLGFLAIDGSKVDDQAMHMIARIPRLKMLQAQGAVAGDDGFEALGRARSLEYLWGRECPNLQGRGFRALTAIPAIKGLALSCAKVDDASLATLSGAAQLRQLMPMDVSDAGFAHVGRCTALENLWCMYCRDTTDAATEHLAGLHNLKTYYAGQTLITDRSLEILSRLNKLEKIELWQIAALTDAGVQLLAKLPNLKTLSISGSPNVTQGIKAAFPNHIRITV